VSISPQSSIEAELASLRDAVRAVRDAAAALGARILIVGAVARDIAYLSRGVHPPRATSDIDIAVALPGWDAYRDLRSRFPTDPGLPEHRFVTNGSVVDLVPFGGVENRDREIARPPRGDHVMSVFGFAEALDGAELVDFGPGLAVPVASVPGLAALKVVAWSERHHDKPTDGTDLRHLIRDYESWQHDRIYEEEADALVRYDFDPALVAGYLLGRDAGRLFDRPGRRRLADLVEPEAAAEGMLVRDMGGGDAARNRRLLVAFRDGLVD
jgi:predicted nucleotidyltransferase